MTSDLGDAVRSPVGIALAKVVELEADLPLPQVQEVGLAAWSLVLCEGRSQSLRQSLRQTLAAPVDAVEVVVVPGQEQSVEG
ncbi:hypothetical protein ACOMHN_046596 [Nucella lapillus]